MRRTAVMIARAVIASSVLLGALSGPVAAAEPFDIGLATSGARIDAVAADARAESAPTVVLVGGLHGDDASAASVRAAVAAYEKRRGRSLRLLAVPVANPDGVALEFPPTGVAYREHSESHALWRWLGARRPISC